MPVTYYTEDEYLKMRSKLELHINQLCFEIKALKDEPCNINKGRITSCGSCQFKGWRSDGPQCTSKEQYFCK